VRRNENRDAAPGSGRLGSGRAGADREGTTIARCAAVLAGDGERVELNLELKRVEETLVATKKILKGDPIK
jgi:hypothetical protein